MDAVKPTITIGSGDQKIVVEANQKIMEALIAAEIFLRSDCGGKGHCGKCLVKIPHATPGAVSPPDELEEKYLGKEDLARGFRLACRTEIFGDITLEIPPTSRLTAEVAQKGATTLLEKLTHVQTPYQGSAPNYGLAVDLGTTTIAVYLCDLRAGSVAASISVRNPQALYGDDVMSRIGAVRMQPELLQRLQTMAVKAIEWAIRSLCRSTRTNAADLSLMTVVGNSTMIHIFAGEDPTSIGTFPYKPKFIEERLFNSDQLGFRFNPSTQIRTLPLITGFIGSDIVSAALAAELEDCKPSTMLVDVGTNGEIIFLGPQGLVATSCATGPAFEGAAIRHGMHAVSGAIDAVKINRTRGTVQCSVIQKDPDNPKSIAGICGTGVVSAVAELIRAGIILGDGRFNLATDSPNLQKDQNGFSEFVLAAPAETQTGRAVTLTQKDIRAIQLAKGALKTGIDLLCAETAVAKPQRILVAGAFGSYINKTDALTIGMFPSLDEADIEIVGNAAGAGAIISLFQEEASTKISRLTRSTHVLDLASHPDFQEAFIASLAFPT
jgi:uncharacterized 2Fe-2S/4Fe-4S cluster protein (DUF4445 family)